MFFIQGCTGEIANYNKTWGRKKTPFKRNLALYSYMVIMAISLQDGGSLFYAFLEYWSTESIQFRGFCREDWHRELTNVLLTRCTKVYGMRDNGKPFISALPSCTASWYSLQRDMHVPVCFHAVHQTSLPDCTEINNFPCIPTSICPRPFHYL